MKKVTLVLIVLMLIFIWGHSAVPMEGSEHESEWVRLKVINPVLNFFGLKGVSGYAVRKLAHVTEFAVLSLLLGLHFAEKRYLSIPFGFVAAFMDESIQLLSERGSSIADVWIDMAGVAAGYLICLLFSKAKRG